MRSVVPSSTNLLQTCLKHVQLSLCPEKTNPQQVANSLDADKAQHGIIQQTCLKKNYNTIHYSTLCPSLRYLFMYVLYSLFIIINRILNIITIIFLAKLHQITLLQTLKNKM